LKILAIGGSGFIGPYVVRHLAAAGHHVTVLHRGGATPSFPPGVERIAADRNRLSSVRPQLSQAAFDVVIDFLLSDHHQAADAMQIFRGIAGRLIALSSGDVYRAYGILLGTEPGPPQSVPLTEDSALRTAKPYSMPHLRHAQAIFPWVTDEYDKVPVERVVMSDPDLPGTVLRLPMIYGPGDPLHRFFPILKRVADGRPALLVQDDAGRLRPPRGYVVNVAAAIALAATSPAAAGRIYNVAEPDSPEEFAFTTQIAQAAGFTGRVVLLPRERLPKHLRSPLNVAQDWLVDSSRIRGELGYNEPIPREQALAETIAWEQAHPPARIDPAMFDYAAEDQALAMSGG